MTIKIAIAGHTNVGKTTLIRTLMRMPIGEVGDAANITKVGEFYYYDGLQATFVDTPGFQDPSAILAHIRGMELDEEEKEELKFDFSAIETIKNCDAVIYVGNLSIVPDLTYKKELEVVQTLQPRIIAVINQAYKQLKGSDKATVEDRFKQWKTMCQKKGVDKVIMFDAHWDSRSKEEEIYDALSNILPYRKRSEFELGLEAFKDRQFKIQQEACETIANTIVQLQKITVQIEKSKYNEAHTKKSSDRKLQEDASGEVSKCVQYLSSLYEVAAENPTSSTSEIITKTNSSVNYTARLGTGAVGAGLFGVIGAVLGVVGGGIVGLLFGGIGAVPGAIGGAHIIGSAGAALGTTAVFWGDVDKVEISLDSPQIAEACKILLATLWGISFVGYGRGRKLTQREAQTIYPHIRKLTDKADISDWTSVDRHRVVDCCMSTLSQLHDVEDWRTV